MSRYHAVYYAGEGGRSSNDPAEMGPFSTLDEARDAIIAQTGDDFGQWSPPAEVAYDGSIGEAWHESDKEGCGGWEIVLRD